MFLINDSYTKDFEPKFPTGHFSTYIFIMYYILLYSSIVYICSMQCGNLRNLQIVLRILRIPRLRAQSVDCVNPQIAWNIPYFLE